MGYSVQDKGLFELRSSTCEVLEKPQRNGAV